MEPKRFGQVFKEHRIRLGKGLRQFCKDNGLDPANISRLERGLLQPPKEERLKSYAESLQLVQGSDEWYEFFDLASAEHGEFPPDLRDEELLAQLPVLFRTMRGDAPSEEQLEHVIRVLRKRT